MGWLTYTCLWTTSYHAGFQEISRCCTRGESKVATQVMNHINEGSIQVLKPKANIRRFKHGNISISGLTKKLKTITALK